MAALLVTNREQFFRTEGLVDRNASESPHSELKKGIKTFVRYGSYPLVHSPFSIYTCFTFTSLPNVMCALRCKCVILDRLKEILRLFVFNIYIGATRYLISQIMQFINYAFVQFKVNTLSVI